MVGPASNYVHAPVFDDQHDAVTVSTSLRSADIAVGAATSSLGLPKTITVDWELVDTKNPLRFDALHDELGPIIVDAFLESRIREAKAAAPDITHESARDDVLVKLKHVWKALIDELKNNQLQGGVAVDSMNIHVARVYADSVLSGCGIFLAGTFADAFQATCDKPTKAIKAVDVLLDKKAFFPKPDESVLYGRVLAVKQEYQGKTCAKAILGQIPKRFPLEKKIYWATSAASTNRTTQEIYKHLGGNIAALIEGETRNCYLYYKSLP